MLGSLNTIWGTVWKEGLAISTTTSRLSQTSFISLLWMLLLEACPCNASKLKTKMDNTAVLKNVK